MKNIQQITESKYFRTTLGIFGCLIAAVIIFASGVHVGERRARYSYQWGANYERNFVSGPREMMGSEGPGRGPQFPGDPRGMMRNFEGRDFRNGHGVAGVVTSIDGNNIVIKDRDGKENSIAVGDKTLIKSGTNDLKISDLKNNDNIVVIGNPGDNGVVNADLIRVFAGPFPDQGNNPSNNNQ